MALDPVWPLLDIYDNPDDEDEYADLTPEAAAAEDAELQRFWSMVREANPHLQRARGEQPEDGS